MKRCISLLLTVCLLATMAAVPALAEAGTYTGVGAGKNGEGSIEVSVTLDDAGVITDVEVTKNGDDAGISDPAVEGVPAAIVAANSLAVDAVAGATLTSNGILEAVEAALTAAGVDPSAYKAAPETDEAEAEKTAVEQTTDVLVIGAGIAGLSSAMSAKENGADVVIIDKMSAPGGTTNLAGGILVCVDSVCRQPSGVRQHGGHQGLLGRENGLQRRGQRLPGSGASGQRAGRYRQDR